MIKKLKNEFKFSGKIEAKIKNFFPDDMLLKS